MCQLLGISSNREVDIKFSFREWRHRGKTNPHGYGFAYLENGTWKIVKSASNLYETRAAETDEVTAARSPIFIGHVRFASVGPQDGTNTHPFQASAFGKSFVFAHNGTVRGIKKRRLRNNKPTGQTDSEHAFLWLLEQVASVRNADFAGELKKLADDVSSKLGRFNFLLSDGTTLWAYADDRLSFIERRPPYGGELVRLHDDGYAISLKEVKRPDERAILVATESLTDEAGWQSLNPRELLIVREGRAVERLDE